MRKKSKTFIYKYFSPLGKLLFNLYYNPTIINKEYIPNEGPIILCGNHIHIMDQMTPIFSTKRLIHYMAKKEYFESKFAFFFRSVGCISVDRSIHDAEAKSEAYEVLINKEALGIFPEGTRNQVSAKKEVLEEIHKLLNEEISIKELKKICKKNQNRVTQYELLKKLQIENKIMEEELREYVLNTNESLHKLEQKGIITHEEYRDTLLMPFKFGTVSLAKKTGATLVPFIMSGDYKFRSKNLKCTILKPIKVNKKTNIESLNKILREKMLSALDQEN